MATSTTNYGLTKPVGTEGNDLDVFNGNMDTIDGVLQQHTDALGIVVDGKQAAVAVAVGQFVILKNSEIEDCDDGLYTAAKAITANTDIDSTYLTAVPGGGLNALYGNLLQGEWVDFSLTTNSSGYGQAPIAKIPITAKPICGYTTNGYAIYFSRGVSSSAWNIFLLDATFAPKGNVTENVYVYILK
jgi:hypothetical protein